MFFEFHGFRFNTNRPDDFTGHSLSVSDVVVIEQDGQQQAHFVDIAGYQDVPDFFVERTQKAEQEPEQPPKVKAADIKIGDTFYASSGVIGRLLKNGM